MRTRKDSSFSACFSRGVGCIIRVLQGFMGHWRGGRWESFSKDVKEGTDVFIRSWGQEAGDGITRSRQLL